MATGDNKAQERERLLEEIRKRAEAAELARIEAEEKKIAESDALDLFPFTPQTDATDAAQPFVELLRLNRKLEPVATSEPHPADADHDRLAAERTAALLHSARQHYEAERYEQSLADLDHVLALMPDHEAAQTLLQDVKKAKELADKLREEEERLIRERQAEQESKPRPRVSEQKPKEPVEAFDSVPQLSEQAPEPRVLQPSALENDVSDPPSLSSDDQEAAPRRKRRSRRTLLVALLLIAFAVAGVSLFKRLVEPVLMQQESIAVIVRSEGGVRDVIRAGFLEQVIDRLAMRSELRIASVRSALAAQDGTPVQVSGMLGVRYVGIVSITANGDQYAVNLELLDVPARQTVLTHAATTGFSALLDEANTIHDVIERGLGLPPESVAPPASFAGRDRAAVELMLAARYLLFMSSATNPDSAIGLLLKSCELSPNFPQAEATLGWAYLLAYERGGRKPSYLEEAHRHLQRSLNLGYKTSEVLGLWGAIEYHRDNYRAAVERYTQALSQAPADARIHHRAALAHLRNGKLERAVEESGAAVALDPLNANARSQLALVLVAARRNAEAVAELERAFSLDAAIADELLDVYCAALVAVNQHERALDMLKTRVAERPDDIVTRYNLARLYQLAGKPRADWQREFETAIRLADELVARKALTGTLMMYKGLAQTRLGMFAEGVATGEAARALAPNDVTLLYSSARLLALQKSHTSEAFSRLSTAVSTQFSLHLLLDLDFALIRPDPRFSAIIGG